jgi:hypothetical protein
MYSSGSVHLYKWDVQPSQQGFDDTTLTVNNELVLSLVAVTA